MPSFNESRGFKMGVRSNLSNTSQSVICPPGPSAMLEVGCCDFSIVISCLSVVYLNRVSVTNRVARDTDDRYDQETDDESSYTISILNNEREVVTFFT